MKGEGLICFIFVGVLSNSEVSTTAVTLHSVGSLRDTGHLQCGSNVVFVCSIPMYKYTMKWFIDSNTVAECVTTNCVRYPPYKVDNIDFSPNTSSGEFNMTINPVTLKVDGRKIRCSYGSKVVQLNLAVKVFPTQNTTEIVESKDDNCNMIRITATTGCVFPSSAITMLWYYYEEGHIPKLYKGRSPIKTSNLSVCSSGTCGGNGVVKISSILSIPDEQNGKDYFFQIAIRHEDTGDIILVNSTRSFKINELTSECGKVTYLLVGIAIGTFIVSPSLLIVVKCLALKWMRKLPNLGTRGQFATSATNLSAHGIVNLRNKNRRGTIRARNASYAVLNVNKLLDDPDETKEEGINGDSGSNASTSINKTKHM